TRFRTGVMTLLSRRNTVKAAAPPHTTSAKRYFMPAPPLPLGASKRLRPPECCPALYIRYAVAMNAKAFTPATIQTVEFKRPFISPPHPLVSLRWAAQAASSASTAHCVSNGTWYLVFGSPLCELPSTKYQLPLSSNQSHGKRFRQLLQIQHQRQT